MRRIEFEEYHSLQHFNRTGDLPHKENMLVTRLGDVANLTDHLQLCCDPENAATRVLAEWVAWCLGRQPDCQFIYVAQTAGLAEGFDAQVYNLTQTDEYRSLFPGIELDISPERLVATPQGGYLRSVACGARGIGQQAGHVEARWRFSGALIVDDVVPGSLIASEKERRRHWFDTVAVPLKGHRNVPIVEIMEIGS